MFSDFGVVWYAFAGAGGGSASKGKAGAAGAGVVSGSVTKNRSRVGLI